MIFKAIDQFLCNHSKRYKLRRICKALHIKPWGWQKEYALTNYPVLRCGGRSSGKTMAVMLRALLYKSNEPADIADLCWMDPDYLNNNLSRVLWYYNEYQNLRYKCEQAGIPINPIFVTHKGGHFYV